MTICTSPFDSESQNSASDVNFEGVSEKPVSTTRDGHLVVRLQGSLFGKNWQPGCLAEPFSATSKLRRTHWGVHNAKKCVPTAQIDQTVLVSVAILRISK